MVLMQESQWTFPSGPTQVQIQGFGLVHLKIYTVYELLECMEGLVLLIQSYRISVTQGNNRIAWRSQY